MDEKWIEKQMKLLDLTREEAIQLWNDDHDIDQGKPKDFDLTKEQEKESKKARNAGKRKANYSLEGQKKRERKPNATVENAERQIDFYIGENHYSLTLTCHRKPK